MKSEVNNSSIQGFLFTHLSPFINEKLESVKQLNTYSDKSGMIVSIFSYPLLCKVVKECLCSTISADNLLISPIDKVLGYPITTDDKVKEVKKYIKTTKPINIVIYPHNTMLFWGIEKYNPYTFFDKFRDALLVLLFKGVSIDIGHLTIKSNDFPYYFTLDIEKENELKWSIYKTKNNKFISFLSEKINITGKEGTLFIPIHQSSNWSKTIQKINKLI